MEENKVQQELLAKNRELEEEKARIKAVLENIGDGVITVNGGGEITFVNNQAVKLLGYTQEELLGKRLFHAIPLTKERGEEVNINERPIHMALLSKRIVNENHFSYVKKDKSALPVSITATPIVLYEMVVGGVVVFRDITKERQVDIMKTEFISLASHQLRTPLSAMKWFTELILDEPEKLTEEQKKLVENVYQANERMIELVNALLNISRIESGRIIIEPIATNLESLIQEVIAELKPRIASRKQKLTVSVVQNLPNINIDAKLVRHVYMNLLTNAIKYSPPESNVSIIVSIVKDEVVSQISDNGYGIPATEHEKVFTKFFRANNILKIETDGTGLGLYLTKSIVESSGGRIWFESAQGKGTTFWFSLPLRGSVAHKGVVTIDA